MFLSFTVAGKQFLPIAFDMPLFRRLIFTEFYLSLFGFLGILFSEGAKWTTFRAFAAKHLSQRMFAADLEIETHEFVSVLKTSMKEPRDARTFFLPIVANIAMQTVLEMRKPYIDEKFQSYIINFQKVSDLMHETSPMDLIPLMRIVPSQRRRLEVLKQKFQVQTRW